MSNQVTPQQKQPSAPQAASADARTSPVAAPSAAEAPRSPAAAGAPAVAEASPGPVTQTPPAAALESSPAAATAVAAVADEGAAVPSPAEAKEEAPAAPAPEAAAAPAPMFEEHVNLAPRPYWNSYVAGVALGLVLLAAFFFTGRGLGASGAVTRMAAHTIHKVEAAARGGTAAEASTIAVHNAYTGQYLKGPKDTLDDFLVYMFVGVLLGGFVSGVLAKRAKFEVTHGLRTTWGRRLAFAAVGGFISAFGTRLARGCTSGQALTGGATLAVGSWVFMFAVFAGGYAIAYFVRKEWT